MHQLLIVSAGVVLSCGTAFAGSFDDLEKLEKFVTNYHHDPAPQRVPEMLRRLLKGQLVKEFTAKETPHQLVLLAHAFGHMARGKAELVRVYESEFADATQPGRLFLLSC